MTYRRKTCDVWIVEVHYGVQFETVHTAPTHREAHQVLKDYRRDAPQYPSRLRMVRERIETPQL